MINKVFKFCKEFDLKENIHFVIMTLALLGICLALYGKYQTQEFIKNDHNTKYFIKDSLSIKKDTL